MKLNKTGDYVWEIPVHDSMQIPARIYGNENIIEELKKEAVQNPGWNSLNQIKNVASLPGFEKNILSMPDVHCGYGASIGTIGASDYKEGLIVFGLIGFDINCGIQTLKTSLTAKDLKGKEEKLANELFEKIPAGLGKGGKLVLNEKEIDEMLVCGAEYVVGKGFGLKKDLELIEEKGRMKDVDVESVSSKAKKRMFKEVGTLGSGNHYLEVQVVDEVFDEGIASTFGLFKGQLLISIHCGSRGLGHQIGMDYLSKVARATEKYGIKVNDKELVCAPIQSDEGREYLHAVN